MIKPIKKKLVRLGNASYGFVVPAYLIKAEVLVLGKEYDIELKESL